MIYDDAVIYSTSMFEESMCLLVAQYAGLKVIERLSENGSRIKNPVLVQYLGEDGDAPGDDLPPPFTLLVGSTLNTDGKIGSMILNRCITAIDCQSAYPLLVDPEEDAPPICPSLARSWELADDRICPEQYKLLPRSDQDDYDPSMIRCFFDNVEDAACPSRNNFDDILHRRNEIISSTIRRNRLTLVRALFATRDKLILHQDYAANKYLYYLYSLMVGYVVESGEPLQTKVIAKRLNDARIPTTNGGTKQFEANDVDRIPGRLGMQTQWKDLKESVGRIAEIRKRPFHRLSNLEKLMLIMSRPLP